MLYTLTEQGTLKPMSRAAIAYTAKRKPGAVLDLRSVSASERRSLDQLALYFTWCGMIDREGHQPGWAHRYNKYEFGLAILARRKPEYRAMLMDMIRPMDYGRRVACMDLVTCTPNFTKDDMTQYMNAVQEHWAGQGVDLPDGDELRDRGEARAMPAGRTRGATRSQTRAQAQDAPQGQE